MHTGSPLVNNLGELLRTHVQQQPERTAVGTSDQGITVSYRQLDALIRSVLDQLSCFGLKQGKRGYVVHRRTRNSPHPS
jgi:acyl-CoA synthetase (AMP-forming)/AMP-acid ligase II